MTAPDTKAIRAKAKMWHLPAGIADAIEWAENILAEIERLDRATRRAAAPDASPAVTDKEKEDDDDF